MGAIGSPADMCTNAVTVPRADATASAAEPQTATAAAAQNRAIARLLMGFGGLYRRMVY
jgi:hypothetical protein